MPRTTSPKQKRRRRPQELPNPALDQNFIESRAGVLAGEPVVKGTRIPARFIADLVRQGVSRRTIGNEYDLTREQIDGAVVFDRVTPRRGRPPVRKVDVKTYFAERARRASVPKALKILKRAGVGNPPRKGDELRPKRKRRSVPHP